jgi:hypothetical protein
LVMLFEVKTEPIKAVEKVIENERKSGRIYF